MKSCVKSQHTTYLVLKHDGNGNKLYTGDQLDLKDGTLLSKIKSINVLKMNDLKIKNRKREREIMYLLPAVYDVRDQLQSAPSNTLTKTEADPVRERRIKRTREKQRGRERERNRGRESEESQWFAKWGAGQLRGS